MTSSKKYLYTVALALLGAVAFPSCNCNGGEDQPTPPPAEERALVSSLTVTVEDLINSSKKDMTTQYAYDKEGRVSSMTGNISSAPPLRSPTSKRVERSVIRRGAKVRGEREGVVSSGLLLSLN